MKFTDILFLIIILLLIAYGILFYLRSQRRKDIDALNERKDEMMAVPIADQLFTLENMNLSGQAKRKYEILEASWQTITIFQFTELETLFVAASQYLDLNNVVRAGNTIKEITSLVDKTEEEIHELNEELSQLLDIEKDNSVRHDELLASYNEARQTVMNHSFDYGPAIETLEKNLHHLELDFTKYNEELTEGDFLQASETLEAIASDLSSLEIILEKIPTMYREVKDIHEDSLDDLRSGYQRMLDSGFHFKQDNLLDQIDRIQEDLNIAKSQIKNADLVEAQTLMDKSEREINSLYDLMEAEIEAQAFVNQQLPLLFTEIDQISENNRLASIEVDRIAQSYVIDKKSSEAIDRFAQAISRSRQTAHDLKEKIQSEETVYTDDRREIKKIQSGLQSISENHKELIERLAKFTKREEQAKKELDKFELELRDLKREIDRRHLPGLSESYFDRFYKVTGQIEGLSQELNRVRIDMNTIDAKVEELRGSLKELAEATETIVDSATLTEYMIQHANRFRVDHPEIEQAINEAQTLFNVEYRYEAALQVIEKALFQIEQEAPSQVRRMYFQEKENRAF